MKYKILSIFLLLLFGCTANHHLRQAKKHLRKAELKGATVNVDTVYKTVNVFVPEVRVDTFIQKVNFRDTIEFWRDRFHVKLKIDTVMKSVFVQGTCETDTVYVNVPVKINNKIKSVIPWKAIAIASFVFLLLILPLFYHKRK